MQKEFRLRDHLRKKDGQGHKSREAISLVEYNRKLGIITASLQEILTSPENDLGIKAFVIFGSWARRNRRTRPTEHSDLDLMPHVPKLLNFEEKNKIRGLISTALENKNLHFENISIDSGVDEAELKQIETKSYAFTKGGYILVKPS